MKKPLKRIGSKGARVRAAPSFEQFVGEEFSSSADRAQLATDVETVIAAARLMETLEGIRAEAGISRAEVARRMNKHAPAITRLLSAEDSNPTLKTLLGLLGSLGLHATLVIEPRERNGRRHERVLDVSAKYGRPRAAAKEATVFAAR